MTYALAIIGGSGLYQMDDFQLEESKDITTPFGKPSGPLMCGKLAGVPVVFLARHGEGHLINPSQINFRANIWALKSIGVQAILSVSAVGSLRGEIEPGHMVMIDQFIDRTKARPSTFFENGIVAHVGFAHPISALLKNILIESCDELGITNHKKGTYVCMEGPQFSTEAESHWYRSMGADVIGMTNLQEAKLAREAEIDYATLALSTDYDCWHPEHDSVTTDQIIQTLTQNISNAQKILAVAVKKYDRNADHDAKDALKNAILSNKKMISNEVKERLKPILAKYF